MNKLLIVALGLGLTAGILLFIYSSGDQAVEQWVEIEPEAPALVTEVDPPQPEVELVEPEPELASETTSAREEVPVAEVVEEEDERPPLATWEDGESQWVDVTVRMPDQAPPDASLVVLGLNAPLDFQEIYGYRGIVPERRRLERDSSYNGLLAVAPVDAVGVARIAFPPDAEHAYIVVAGNYLYSPNAESVDLSTGQVTLVPELGAWVTGSVRPPAGAEGQWSEVKVRLSPDLSSNINLGTTSGPRVSMRQNCEIGESFDFGAVPLSSSFTVGVESEDFALNYTEGYKPEPGEHLTVNLELLPGSRIAGRVIDENGEPVAGAAVDAKTGEFFGTIVFEARETETDEEGLFELTAVRSGEVWLFVDQEGFRKYKSPGAIEVVEGVDQTYPDIKLSMGSRFEGVVMYPDGSPAVGATLKVEVDFSANVAGTPMNEAKLSGAGQSVTADERGEFSIGGLSEGPYRLVASHSQTEDSSLVQGTWRAEASGLNPTEDVEASTQLLLVLEAPLSIRGVVLDLAGEPITDFELTASLASTQWWLPSQTTEQESFETEDGTFLMKDLQVGKWSLTGKAEGYAIPEGVEFKLPQDEFVELRLSRPSSISGRVLGPDGEPIVGATIEPELDMQQMVLRNQGGGSEISSVISDATGAFLMEGLRPGAGTILATKDGWAPSEGFGFDAKEGETIRDVELTLRVGGTITGELMDDDGNPKVGADIFIQQPAGMRRRTTKTDDEGRFAEEHLAPAEWQVMALNLTSDSGEFDQAEMLSTMKIAMVTLEDGEEVHVVLGAPPENPVELEGRVTASGDPVEGAIISFIPSTGGGMEKMALESTDEEGAFSTTLVEPGDYLVTIQKMGLMGQQNNLEFRRRVPDEDAFELNFELPVARISGTIFGPDGDPLPQARVTLNIDGGAEFGTMFGGKYAETTSDDAGDYELQYLRPGGYLVAAGGNVLGGMFGEDSSTKGRIVNRVQVNEGQWLRNVDFHLEEPGSISGMVLDHAGQPVAKAVLFARDENGNLLETFSFLTSDAGGRFKYHGLAPGSYTISARMDNSASGENEIIRVRSGEETAAEIVLDPGTILKVTLQDKSGALVAAVVSVTDDKGREMNGMLAIQDIMEKYTSGVGSLEQNVGPLPPGTYTIRASTEDGRSTRKTITLSGQEQRKLRLRLK